jgi:hypothetical protein
VLRLGEDNLSDQLPLIVSEQNWDREVLANRLVKRCPLYNIPVGVNHSHRVRERLNDACGFINRFRGGDVGFGNHKDSSGL